MFNRILFLVCLLFFWSPMLYGQASEKWLTVEAGATFNQSDYNWSIAGNLDGESPNILSELKFNKIVSLGYYLEGNYTLINHLTFSAYYQRNKVFNGHGYDTDYRGDNRTDPTFVEAFSSNNGHLMVLKGGMSTLITLFKKIDIIPSLSYYKKRQKFYLLSHRRQDLESTYRATMQGVDLSIASKLYIHNSISLSLALHYWVIDYNAEANWNLRDIFQHPLSFSHRANGSGLGADAAAGYHITRRIAAVMRGSINRTTIGEGTDTAYLATGNEMKTQFNGADNLLYELRAGIRISI